MRTLLVTLLLATGASASPLEVLGWTPDGSAVAVVEHGTGEGSGLPWARVTFYDVARSKPLAAPLKVELDSGTEADAVAQAKTKAEAERNRLKLAKLVAGKQIDHDDKGELHEASGAPIGTVDVKNRKAKGACEDPLKPMLVDVVIHWMDDDKPFRVLAEKKVPKERPCTTGCTLGPVYAQAKGALFVLSCGAKDFEGAATAAFPVTARLPYGLDEDLPPQ